ncbi:BsuPI-related putative proteinase inhibitor [Halocatena marina]|uniref:BsuPI-related putative proteinase inhibitor n=1 Tax=Halocatena marina TaxID=2934937 RepID=UPI00200E1BD2|nr:BsuPI-related putative proteinase inhibitor [Halocatena marina]
MVEGTLTVNPGQPVVFTFTVTNTTDQPVSLRFQDACKADFVARVEDTERWRWSVGQMFAQILEEVSLAPNEQTTFEAAWDDPDPGSYTAHAELMANNTTCEAETTFSVE